MKTLLLAVATLWAIPLQAQNSTTHLDASRHEVSFDAGPFDVPAMQMHGGMDHSAMQMGHGEHVRTLYQFTWPVD